MKKMILVALFAAFAFQTKAQIVEATPVRTIKGLKSRVTHFSMNPSEDRLIVGFGEYAAIYDYSKGKKLYTFEHDYNGQTSVYYTEYHPEMDYVVTVDLKGKKRFWNATNGKLAEQVRGSKDFGPDNRGVIAMGLTNGNVESRYFYTQAEIAIPGSTVIAKATKKSSIQFIDTAQDNKVIQELKFPETKDNFHMYPCWITPDGKFFVTGSDTGEVLFYTLN
jgi:WD40 repeat protein